MLGKKTGICSFSPRGRNTLLQLKIQLRPKSMHLETNKSGYDTKKSSALTTGKCFFFVYCSSPTISVMHAGLWTQGKTTAVMIVAAHAESFSVRAASVLSRECDQWQSRNSKDQETQTAKDEESTVCLKPSCCEVRKMVRLGERGRREDAMWCWSHAMLLALRVIRWAPRPLSEVGSNKQRTSGIPVHGKTQGTCSALLIQLL